MAKGKATKAAFERSKFDKERPGVKEGSRRDIAMDKKQFSAFKKSRGK